jgi:tetratricopeptide (TPR) repeat protein
MSLISSVALSLIGFGLSKYLGESELSDALYSELGVGSLGDVFKDGSDHALSKILNKTPDYNKTQLNHDLNKAARKSLLLATWFACRGVLLEYRDDDSVKPEKRWIAKLADSLLTKIKSSLDEVPQSNLNEADVLAVFNANNQAEIEAKLITKLQAEIFDIIRTDADSFSLFNQTGFNLLQKNIEKGWTEQDNPTSPVHSYNWFSLVCGIFNDECKNPRIGFALQNKLFRNLHIKLGERGESFDLLYREIADIKQTTYRTEGKTEFLIDFTKDFRTEVFYKLNEILEELRNTPKPAIPTEFVRNLTNLDAVVFGRDYESETIRDAFCGSGSFAEKRFYLVVAPTGLGKSYCLIKALREVAEANSIKPDYFNRVQRIIRIDCEQTKSLSQIVSEFANIIGLDIGYPNDLGFPFAYLNGVLFHHIRSIGKVWLILDNFEDWLSGDNKYQLINRDIYAFLEALFKGNHTIRGVFLSQSALRFESDEHFEAIDDAGEMIAKGLPEVEALAMMRTNGKSVGLDNEPESRLQAFLSKTDYIPQAVTSLIGFLKSIRHTPNGTLQSVLADFTTFDAHEQKDGETHTKYLISRQIAAQSPEVKLLLQAVAFFDKPVAYEALRLLADDEAISRLVEHNLATKERDLRGSVYYNLHNYFGKQTLATLPKFEDSFDIELYANNLFNAGYNQNKHHFLTNAINLYECSEKIYKYLKLPNDLASAYVNKGVLLDNLGKLNEAIAEYDKAILIRERLVKGGRTELENDLANAYMSKGVSLDNLGKLNEAIAEYDNAISIYERLVKGGQTKLENDLASTYVNKGGSLDSLGKLNEGTVEFDKAIAIYEDLVKQGRTELANELAAAYNNKGESLRNLGKLNEAIIETEKAIAIRKPLVASGRTELTNALAIAYNNKGEILVQLNKLNEAIEFYDTAINLWEETRQRGEVQNLPRLAECLGNRLDTHRTAGNADLAEKDMRRLHELLAFTKQHKETEHLGEAIQTEIDKRS